MELTEEEMQLIYDQKFLLAKININSKVQGLLSDTRKSLTSVNGLGKLPFLSKSVLSKGKISKGENYRGLPYQVLDFPGLFSSENIFAFRTMFWWGNFFSFTLHLQGASLEYYRQKVLKNHEMLMNQQVHIAVGKSPWEYHYEKDNYELLSNKNIHFIESHRFLKISKRIELNQWENVPFVSTNFLQQLVGILE